MPGTVENIQQEPIQDWTVAACALDHHDKRLSWGEVVGGGWFPSVQTEEVDGSNPESRGLSETVASVKLTAS